jgi:ATP-dependent protease ClpP protease subunit
MTGQIYIYGVIGKSTTFDSVIKQIDAKYDSYDVHIISEGGDVFEGYAIYNALKNTGKTITVYIEGLCASIATLIAGAGDKIIMNEKSQFMIHNPLVRDTSGDANDLRNVADQLDKIKTQLIDVYQSRTGLPQAQLWEMYDNETWLLPDQAKAMGFVDEVRDSLKAVALANIQNFKKMEKQNKFESIVSSLRKFFNDEGVKTNQIPETLQDGTTVIVLSEDGNFTGKQVVKEDGTPLAAGNYTLSSGKILVVADGGVITEVQDGSAPPANDAPPAQDAAVAELTAKLEALTKENAELKSAIEARNEAESKAVARANKFENKLIQVEAELKKLETESVGGSDAPDKGVKKQPDMPDMATYDPMGDEMLKIINRQRK